MRVSAKRFERNGSVYEHAGCHTRVLDVRTGQDVEAGDTSDPTLFAAAVALRSDDARRFVELLATRVATDSQVDERSLSLAFREVAAGFRATVGTVNATVVIAHDGRLIVLQASDRTHALHVSGRALAALSSTLESVDGTIAAAYGAPPPWVESRAYDIIVRAIGAHPSPVHTITTAQWAPGDAIVLGSEPVLTAFAREVAKGADVDLAFATAEREQDVGSHLVGVLVRAS